MDKELTKQGVRNHALITVGIAPCSWMYPDYGLQIWVEIAGGGRASVHNEQLRFADATEADFDALVEQVRIVPCSRCTRAAFDPASVSTNREGLCEECWMTDWQKEVDAARRKETDFLAEQDARQARAGFTHRVTAWIHPRRGDDRQIDIYYKAAPPTEDIKAVIRKRGSVIDTDYQVVTLPAQVPARPRIVKRK